MPKYEIQSPKTGRVYRAEFEGDPSDEDFLAASNHFDEEYEKEASPVGVTLRSAARSIVPALGGGHVGTMIGAGLAGAAEGALTGSVEPGLGTIVGGLIGGAAGMYGAGKLQEEVANKIDPSLSNPFSTASEQRDVAAHPYVSELGGLLLFKPNPIKFATALDSIASDEGRQLLKQGYTLQKELSTLAEKLTPKEAASRAAEIISSPAHQAFDAALGVGSNVGIGLGMGALQGEDLPSMLRGAAGGALFNDAWGHAKGIDRRIDDTSKVSQSETKPIDVDASTIPPAPSEQTPSVEDARIQALKEQAKQNLAAQPEDMGIGFDPQLTEHVAGVIDQTTLAPAVQEAARQALASKQKTALDLEKEEADRQIEDAFEKPPPRETGPKSVLENAPQGLVQPALSDPLFPELKTMGSPVQLSQGKIGPILPDVEIQGGAKEASQKTREEDREYHTQNKPRIVSAAFQDPNGKWHTGSNHAEAFKQAHGETKKVPVRNRRERPTFGFVAEDSTGKRRIVSREEALPIAEESGQLKKVLPEGAKLHTDDISDYDGRFKQLSRTPEDVPADHIEAGFKNEEEAQKAYEEKGIKEVGETIDEFLSRKHCE